MSMGVLNNIAATYAANNLSNTQASLQNVLTQLSSGSRINSGADDAAGLSLANGLQANQSALTQSASNVSLGVGLLQTADGALSQVNNLLNRAVTLATEAGNGTLNTSQSGAANQEYQSILAEINSIGATTTYNGQAVFGAQTGTAAAPATASFSIYTSDGSSPAHRRTHSASRNSPAPRWVTLAAPSTRRLWQRHHLHRRRRHRSEHDQSHRRHHCSRHHSRTGGAHSHHQRHQRRGGAARLPRLADQHAELDRQRRDHAEREPGVGIELHHGHRLHHRPRRSCRSTRS